MLYEAVVSPGRRTLSDVGRDRPRLAENDSRRLKRSQNWPSASVLEHSTRARTMRSVGLAMGRIPYRLQAGTIWFLRAVGRTNRTPEINLQRLVIIVLPGGGGKK